MAIAAQTELRTQSSSTAFTRPATMRAVLQSGYGSTDVLRYGSTSSPVPGPGEVLVRVHAAGLDRGTWHFMTGRPYMMRCMGFGFFGPKNPVPGLDLSGTVVEVGSGVSRWRVGDRVFGVGMGSFAEYACAREDKLAGMPEGLGFSEAAALGISGLTALQALRDAGQLQPGERVLIVGASGGVGSYAVQVAKAFGAEVTGVCSTAKQDSVRALGADHVRSYENGDCCDGSQQYDLILDIGGNTALKRLRRALTPSGRLVFVGGENGGDWGGWFERQLEAAVLSPFVKQRFVMLMSRERGSDLEQLAQLWAAGKLQPLIHREWTLEDVAAAVHELEAGKVCGKSVFCVA